MVGIVDKIAEVFNEFSENTAFVINSKHYSYSVFGKKVSGIINKIDSYQSVNQKKIAVIENDDLETYASILAILLSGNAYVVLNPANPDKRNLDILKEIDVDIILSSKEHNLVNVVEDNIPVVYTEGLISDDKIKKTTVSDEDIAYIIFTSGSTGKPKGVPISIANINAFYNSYKSLGFKVSENDRFLQMFDLTFDVSVVSTLFPLTVGASIYTVPMNTVKYLKVYELLEDEKISFATIPPSILSLLRPYFDEIQIPDLKNLILTAEASFESVIKDFLPCAPSAQITNLYGPTEATIYCSYYKLNRENIYSNNDLLSIGRIFPDMKYLIVDEDYLPMEKGSKGQLLISGDQVTKGYWNNTEKNVEAFVDIEREGEVIRYYKTGDICFENEDNYLMYCGRADYQVQIQGFRVELSEIEYNVRQVGNIKENVVLPLKDNSDNLNLHLFIKDVDISDKEILDSLKKGLPKYMIPRKIHRLKEFPLNNSGKVDRKKILETI